MLHLIAVYSYDLDDLSLDVDALVQFAIMHIFVGVVDVLYLVSHSPLVVLVKLATERNEGSILIWLVIAYVELSVNLVLLYFVSHEVRDLLLVLEIVDEVGKLVVVTRNVD